MVEKMSLEQVRTKLRELAHASCMMPGVYHQMADAIDAHLASQPAEQPRDGAVAFRIVGRHGPYPWVDVSVLADGEGIETIVGEQERVEYAYAQPKAATDAQAENWKTLDRRRVMDLGIDWDRACKAANERAELTEPKAAAKLRSALQPIIEAAILAGLSSHPAPSQAVVTVDAKAEQAMGEGVGDGILDAAMLAWSGYWCDCNDANMAGNNRDAVEKALEAVGIQRPAVATPAEVTDAQIREWCERHYLFNLGSNLTDARAAFEDAQSLASPSAGAVVPDDLIHVALEANDMCRSSFQVAERVATQYATVYAGTNFGALHEQLKMSLDRQHRVLKPYREAMLAAAPESGGL